LKSKCTRRQEFIVGGWLSSTATGRDLRSILVGYYEGDQLVYAGKIGTGFNGANSADLLERLRKHGRKTHPFAAVPKEVARGVHWVEPAVVVEAEFATWTHDRVVRHAAFKGVREDKEPKSVTLELPVDEDAAGSTPKPARPGNDYAGVKLTHPDRVLWPDDGFTKEMLADYYASVAGLMLPHIVNRPLSLVRCPDGIKGQCFFQRHMGQGLPDTVKPVAVREEKEPYLAIEDAAGLFSLVQFSALELHPWGASVEDPEHPDRIIMDFDPSEELPWSRVVDAAFECRDRLNDMGLVSFVKTTGGKGLHVVIPIERRNTWAEVKAFALDLASAMAADNRLFLTHMAKRARKGRIFIDYLRNDRTSTAIAPYSTRSRPGAPIAVPVSWDELRSLPSGRHYTLGTIGRRVSATMADPWVNLGKVRQKLDSKPKRSVRRK
jgi:bifunctional non-homologous end joining protein LigD